MNISANLNQPWNSILSTTSLFSSCKTQSDINKLHARLITTGLIKHSFLTTKLILSFTSSHHTPLVNFARYVLNFRNDGDPFVWNLVLKCFSHGDEPVEAVVLFVLMLEKGVFFDKFSISLVLKACCRMGMVNEGVMIHGLLRKFEFGCELVVQNCLICMYCKCGLVEFGRQVFDKMGVRDSVSFNSMIDGYVKNGKVGLGREVFDSMPGELRNLVSWNCMICGYVDKFESAWELFKEMPVRDLISWNLMLDCCAKCGKMEVAFDLFSRMPRRDVISWANMIDGYGRLGCVDVARGLFDDMGERDVVSYNVMVAGYVQNGYFKEALELFHDMLCERKFCPDRTTLVIALSATAQLGNIDEGIAVHQYLEKNGFIAEGKLGVALIDMYAKSGSIEIAMHVFENIEERSVDHWNAMIGGLAIHGLGEVAFGLFIEMERLCVRPDDITFIGVLNACGHAGMVKEGMICFEIMRRIHKLEPKLQHYGCMVDILGRAGYIAEAARFIQDMPIEPNDVVWRTLLSACKSYENLNIGEQVAKYLIQRDPRSSSSYVLLSNMYASFSMWDCVRDVRTRMKERELEKVPGCSWIELEGAVHEFFVGDRSHPQVQEIYSSLDKWHTIRDIMFRAGLAPEYPVDLYHLIKRAVAIRKHLERTLSLVKQPPPVCLWRREDTFVWKLGFGTHVIHLSEEEEFLQMKKVHRKVTELIGFIDGAWHCDKDQQIRAGIGGYLKDNQGNLLFFFSGPSTAKTAFDCEYEAMIFLVKSICHSPWRLSRCLIYTDSAELVGNLQNVKFNFLRKEEDDIQYFLSTSKFEFKKVDRILNWEADKRAKQGRSREKNLFAWF
ncbi:Chlororespiratory reduction 4 [Heracleum sosnowskyi]|uniref:Chlororespiratory reduction 4 n=1 Tax=Heracleum sosnowskyi TaxID=360622 RepID=A0AAD8MID2_9APIA|nr:Chlororespiratory reduction 4 [Heracleum sosnowskyi]